jgi:serine/threonine protein kinase
MEDWFDSTEQPLPDTPSEGRPCFHAWAIIPASMLAPGTQLGPFEIQSLLGSGGMGEVYRARDNRLDRTVAIKIIPPSFSSDSIRRQRFQRESRAISALQHPNICTLYEVGQQDGVDYLVMEYQEGETLGVRLAKARLGIGQVLTYGIEIANAVDAAHARGIIHRDLKPGNIFLTLRGGCKALDFGLAQIETEESPEAPTLTQMDLLTSPGATVGQWVICHQNRHAGKLWTTGPTFSHWGACCTRWPREKWHSPEKHPPSFSKPF